MNNETMTRADINAHFISLLEDYPFDRALKKYAEDIRTLHDTGRIDPVNYIVALELYVKVCDRNVFEEEA